jgi:hypothetical protein
MSVSARFFLTFALALASGCGSSLIETRLDDPSKLPERYGVVVVQTVSNAYRLSDMLYNWTALFVVDLDDTEKRYRLDAKNTGMLDNRVFVGALPPGRYAIYNLHSFGGGGDYSYWLNARVPRLVGSFEVHEDRLTSLGALVYQPLGEVDSERGGKVSTYVVTRVDDDEDLSEFVREAYPDFHARLESDFVDGWEGDGLAAVRADLADRIRSIAHAERPIRLSDGTAALGANLGQVFWRNGNGEWERTDTGYVLQLGAVARVDDGYVLAGERGLVLVGPSRQGPWAHVRGPGTQEAVYWMHELPGGDLVALTRSALRVRFYRVSHDFSEWRVLRQFAFERTVFFTGAGMVHAAMLSSGAVLVFGDKKRLVYDPATGRIEESDSDNLFQFAQQPDGTLVALPGSAWSGVGPPRYSRDEGRTWTRIARVPRAESWDAVLRVPPVVLPDDRVALVSRRMVIGTTTRGQRPVPSEERMLRVAAGRDTIDSWGQAMENACFRLVPEWSTPDLLFTLCEDGRVLRSPDHGRTWVTDRAIELPESAVPEALKGENTEA